MKPAYFADYTSFPAEQNRLRIWTGIVWYFSTDFGLE